MVDADVVGHNRARALQESRASSIVWHHGAAAVVAAVGHQCARALLESRASCNMHMRGRDPSRRFPEFKINLCCANARALHRGAGGKGSEPNEEGYDYPERCGECNAFAPLMPHLERASLLPGRLDVPCRRGLPPHQNALLDALTFAALTEPKSRSLTSDLESNPSLLTT